MRRLPPLLMLLLLVATACGDDDGGTPITTPSYEAFRGQPTACGADRPPAAQEMQFSAPEDLDLGSAAIEATITTSCGEIRAQLYPDVAPETVNSFVFLAEQGYFDGTVSHRIAPGFVIQGGDPTATGRGGPGYVVPDELPPEGFAYETGILAMANAGAGTTGSQFFIVTGSIDLPPSYSVFGAVLSGYEVIDEIESVPLAQRPNSFEVSVPLESVYIETITIDR